MFNVGGAEVLVILLVALVVLGPDKLPGAVRSVGNMVGELRKVSNGFQAEMRNAMSVDDRPTSTKPTSTPTTSTAPTTSSSPTPAASTPAELERPPQDEPRTNDAMFGPAPDERRPTE